MCIRDSYLTPAASASDMGSVIDAVPDEKKPRSVLGAKWQQGDGVIKLQQVFDAGAAQQAGLSAGDEIIAVDGIRMDSKQLESYLSRSEPSREVCIHLFRRDELLQFTLKPLPAPDDTCRFRLPDDLDEQTRKRQQAWLGGHAKRA